MLQFWWRTRITFENPPVRFREEYSNVMDKYRSHGRQEQAGKKNDCSCWVSTLRLVRCRIGNITLGQLQPGDMIEMLRKMVYKNYSMNSAYEAGEAGYIISTDTAKLTSVLFIITFPGIILGAGYSAGHRRKVNHEFWSASAFIKPVNRSVSPEWFLTRLPSPISPMWFVLPAYRGKEVKQILMKTIHAHPDLAEPAQVVAGVQRCTRSLCAVWVDAHPTKTCGQTIYAVT